MTEHLEQLAKQKNFAALTSAERSVVLQEMSANEYEALQLTLSIVAGMDRDARPSDALRLQLLSHSSLSPPPTPVPGITTRHLIWTAVSSAIIGAWLMFVWHTAPPIQKEDVRPTQNTVAQKDTILLRDTIILRDTVVLTRTRWQIKYRQTAVIDSTQAPAQATRSMEKTGTPIGDMPALMDFLGVNR